MSEITELNVNMLIRLSKEPRYKWQAELLNPYDISERIAIAWGESRNEAINNLMDSLAGKYVEQWKVK